jgi:hypothetical protein
MAFICCTSGSGCPKSRNTFPLPCTNSIASSFIAAPPSVSSAAHGPDRSHAAAS